MMDSEMLFDKFINFEKEHALFDLKCEEIYYWHLIRSWLYRSLLKEDSEYDNLNKKRGTISEIVKKATVSATNGLLNIKQFPLKKNHCDILFSSPWNFRLVNGENIDIFVQYFEIDKKFSTRTFEYNDSKHLSTKRDISSSFIDLKMMCDYLKFTLGKKIEKQSNLFEVDHIVELLNDELGVNLSANQIKNRICYSICVSDSYYRSINKYLKKIQPKVIVMTNAYGLRHFATIRAAKELGIKTIELQHGLIGKYHIDYNFADLDSGGRYCPDYLFTFGEYWNDTCRSTYNLKKIAIGNRYVELVDDANKGVERDSKTVVFYSMKKNEFADFVCRFADLVKFQNYKIIFKYHPVECGKADYQQLKKKDIQIINQPTEVQDFLTRYEHHVSVGSTVLYEGAMRGVSIYVWDIPGKEHTRDLTDNGYGCIVKDEYDLLKQITNFANQKNMQIKERLIRPNANENMNNELEAILYGEGECGERKY